jgi:diguanylate cyclase (GGDEF)-like protein
MARLSHVITGPDGAFESWSETLPALLGVDAERMPRSTREWLEHIHPEDRERFRRTSIEAAVSGSRADIEYRLVRSDGAALDIRQSIEPLPLKPGAPQRWFGTLQDISADKRAASKIRRLNRVHRVLSGINTLIVRAQQRDELFQEACRVAVEEGGFRMAWVGLLDREASTVRPVASAGEVGDYLDKAPLEVLENQPGGLGLAGRALRARQPVVSNNVRDDSQLVMREPMLARGINSVALIPLVVGDEAIGAFALYAAEPGFFDEEEMKLLVELAGDIAFALDHMEKVAKLDYLAYYDELTGLANRALFRERAAQLLGALHGQRAALVIMDIDRFKTISDTLGRQSGDSLLKQVAERMKRHSEDPSHLARLGADHFAAIVPEVRTEEEFARRHAANMQEYFGGAFVLGGTELRISAKAGIAMYPADGTDADSLLRNAESALKKAKASGVRYLFYASHMTGRVAEKLALENELRQALERNEFVLYYQPKVSVDERAIVGVEALLRWQRPGKGLVMPDKFIALLEETGLILAVGAWALRRAAAAQRSWAARGLMAPRVAVNVSQLQLRQTDFIDVVEQAMADDVAPASIDLEITESLVMEDVASNIQKLRDAHDLGVRVAIDDFGTGYSSLGHLSRLPVEALKIDRSFIMRMQDDPNATTLVSTIISLAHSLRLKVIAEGVETEEQAKLLRLLRCDEMQGNLISEPLPEEALVKLLR